MMRIWIDGDGCPSQCKEVLFKAAMRRQVPLVMVANRLLKVPLSDFVSRIVVACLPDAADHVIYKNVTPDDIVISTDFRLIRGVLSKGAYALNSRGKTFTTESFSRSGYVRAAKMSDIYHHNLVSHKQASFSKRDKAQFANALDRLLTRIEQNNTHIVSVTASYKLTNISLSKFA